MHSICYLGCCWMHIIQPKSIFEINLKIHMIILFDINHQFPERICCSSSGKYKLKCFCFWKPHHFTWHQVRMNNLNIKSILWLWKSSNKIECIFIWNSFLGFSSWHCTHIDTYFATSSRARINVCSNRAINSISKSSGVSSRFSE